MTTVEVPTVAELEERASAADEETTAIEREIGAATLDGKSTTNLLANLDDARAEGLRTRIAINEAQRRETEAEAEAATEARRQERIQIYRSVVDWLPLVTKYVTTRAALTEIEAELEARPPAPIVGHLKARVITWLDPSVADLDERLIQSLPKPPRKGQTASMPDPAKFTPERITELLSRAVELAEAEERGESIAVTPGELRERAASHRRTQVKERRQRG
jgi:hypothetical protein